MKRIMLFAWILLIIAAGGLAAFDDPTRDSWQQPEKVMEAIGVKPGMVIGIAGAGEGYFSLKMAPKVGPTGKIYSNDINQSKLDELKEKYLAKNIRNIQIIAGEYEDPLFPDGSLDMIFMCYVIHDVGSPRAFLKNMRKDLKPGARLVILERDPVKVPSAADHFWSRKKLLRIVKDAGYRLVRTETFLSKDNIYIFEPL